MLTKDELKALTINHLDELMTLLNDALSGVGLEDLESTLTRLGRGGRLPHWYIGLKDEGKLPNYDGKTVGSILEMLFVAVLEQKIIVNLKHKINPLKINPARGVDLPDIDLGIKSPSKNYCTSEPFFSAYERLYGNEHDALILLTDYQEAKKKSLLTLHVTDWKYLKKTEIADYNLCKLALMNRGWLLEEDESIVKRLFRFLAYANQSDWRANQLLKLIEELNSPEKIAINLEASIKDFDRQNKKREKTGLVPLPDSEKTALIKISGVSPIWLGVLNAAENWVVEVLKDAARAANENEWTRLRDGPLDGKIGMSFALQWRYNFGQVFRAQQAEGINIEIPGQLDLDQEVN